MLSSPLDAIIPCSHAPFLVSRYMRAHWDNSIHPFSPGAKDHRVALRTAFEGISAESKAHYQVLAYSRHTHMKPTPVQQHHKLQAASLSALSLATTTQPPKPLPLRAWIDMYMRAKLECFDTESNFFSLHVSPQTDCALVERLTYARFKGLNM